jgi:hypothetical protein
MSADSKHVDDGEYWSIRGTKMMGRGREVLEKKKQLNYHFCHHASHTEWPVSEAGPPQ